MGKHSGTPEVDEHGPDDRTGQNRRLLLLGGGVTVTLVAWGFLVVEAVEFGGKARDGEAAGWLFLLFAAVGATACMFVTLILATRVVAVVRGMAPQRNIPKRDVPPGGRRAAR